MAIEPQRIESWFRLAASCMSESPDWKLDASRPDASLSHCSIPDGTLVKFDFRNIFIRNAPEDPADMLIRPEVRGRWNQLAPSANKIRHLQTFAPGDALVEQTPITRGLVRLLARVLFGNCQGPFPSLHKGHPNLARHQLRKDFPETGDCSYAEFYNGSSQECILICRSEGAGYFRIVIAFRTNICKAPWGRWATTFFFMMLELVYTAACEFVNRPGVPEMRAIDDQLYVVLSLRNYNRGAPLVPYSSTFAEEEQEVFTVHTGKDIGLESWTRFRSKTGGKFRFAEYMQCFLERLGHCVQTHESLDGRMLVPYQCVVLREDWETLRELFAPAFGKQKAAYRRANGGASAPGWTEDLKAHFLSRRSAHRTSQPVAQVSADWDESGEDALKLVVRNTFLELQEDTEPNCSGSRRRSKSCAAEHRED